MFQDPARRLRAKLMRLRADSVHRFIHGLRDGIGGVAGDEFTERAPIDFASRASKLLGKGLRLGEDRVRDRNGDLHTLSMKCVGGGVKGRGARVADSEQLDPKSAARELGDDLKTIKPRAALRGFAESSLQSIYGHKMIAQAPNNPVESLLLMLRGQERFWHRTPLQSLEAILCHGAIVPNIGQFDCNSTQSESSYGRHMKAVSIFDFDSASEDAVLHQACGNLFVPGLDAIVLIGIEREELDHAKLQLPHEVSNGLWKLRLSGQASGLTHVPEIEALYVGELPSAAFSYYYLVSQSGRFFKVPSEANAITSLNEKYAEWRADDELSAAERRSRGEWSLAEVSAFNNHRDNP
jgi:hypothetical protein